MEPYSKEHALLPVPTLKYSGYCFPTTYTKEDLVPYSPVTENHVDTGLILLELAEAVVRQSDNTAENLLSEAIDGPNGFEQALNQIGDNIIEADRLEPE